MSQKSLSDHDKTRFKIYRDYFISYLTENSPKLKPTSVKLYARSVGLVAVSILPSDMNHIDIDLFLQGLKNSYDNQLEEISCLEIDLSGNQNNNNSLINGVGKILETHQEIEKLDDILVILLQHIRTRSKSLRDQIADKKSRNHKTEEEEKHMKPFEEYVKVAEKIYKEYLELVKKAKTVEPIEEGYKSYLPKRKFRDMILVSLILLNKTKTQGITLHSILRLVEYTDLFVWTPKEKPPKDGKNYLSLEESKIYLQHSKTTGGMIGSDKKQPSLKQFKIFNKKIIDMIRLYVEVHDIPNNKPLFTSSFTQGDCNVPMNKTALSKLLKVIFQDISPHTTIGLIRKAYDNRKLDMNGNQTLKSAKLNDHSLETIETFYKKI